MPRPDPRNCDHRFMGYRDQPLCPDCLATYEERQALARERTRAVGATQAERWEQWRQSRKATA